jgi:hypothetical protein
LSVAISAALLPTSGRVAGLKKCGLISYADRHWGLRLMSLELRRVILFTSNIAHSADRGRSFHVMVGADST